MFLMFDLSQFDHEVIQAFVLFVAGMTLVAFTWFLLCSSSPKRSSQMLVLSRRADPEVNTLLFVVDSLPDLMIKVTILGVEAGRVKLGIEAPSDVRVVRGEIDLHVPGLPKERSHVCSAL
jgi:carbon storage regulator CsrA